MFWKRMFLVFDIKYCHLLVINQCFSFCRLNSHLCKLYGCVHMNRKIQGWLFVLNIRTKWKQLKMLEAERTLKVSSIWIKVIWKYREGPVYTRTVSTKRVFVLGTVAVNGYGIPLVTTQSTCCIKFSLLAQFSSVNGTYKETSHFLYPVWEELKMWAPGSWNVSTCDIHIKTSKNFSFILMKIWNQTLKQFRSKSASFARKCSRHYFKRETFSFTFNLFSNRSNNKLTSFPFDETLCKI